MMYLMKTLILQKIVVPTFITELCILPVSLLYKSTTHFYIIQQPKWLGFATQNLTALVMDNTKSNMVKQIS